MRRKSDPPHASVHSAGRSVINAMIVLISSHRWARTRRYGASAGLIHNDL